MYAYYIKMNTEKKIDEMHDLLHSIDKNVAVIKSDVKRINDSVKKHDDRIIVLEKGQANLKGKVTLIAGAVGIVFSVFTSIFLPMRFNPQQIKV